MNSILKQQLEDWKAKQGKQLPPHWCAYIARDHQPGKLAAGGFGELPHRERGQRELPPATEAMPDEKLFGLTRPTRAPRRQRPSWQFDPGYVPPDNRHNLAFWFRLAECWKWLTSGKAQTSPLGGNSDKPASARDPRGNRGMRKAA